VFPCIRRGPRQQITTWKPLYPWVGACWSVLHESRWGRTRTSCILRIAYSYTLALCHQRPSSNASVSSGMRRYGMSVRDALAAPIPNIETELKRALKYQSSRAHKSNARSRSTLGNSSTARSPTRKMYQALVDSHSPTESSRLV
jgi:hypothetical protein